MKSGENMRGSIALMGFGEAGRAFSGGWTLPEGGTIRAFDIKSLSAATTDEMAARYKTAAVSGQPSAAEAVTGAEIVVSLVTADQALVAAESAAPHLAPGALYFDGNSCAPQTKCAAAERVEAAGAHYIDMAIMAPVKPKKHETPVLLAGPLAEEAAERIEALGMKPRVAGDRVGQASSIKMMRSVMIKGIEALMAESLLSARRAGVEDAVLASLEASDPEFPWRKRAIYNLERMMVHGNRRAAEMEEVAKTVASFGLPNRMASAIAAWEADIGALGLDGGTDDLEDRADRILDALKP